MNRFYHPCSESNRLIYDTGRMGYLSIVDKYYDT